MVRVRRSRFLKGVRSAMAKRFSGRLYTAERRVREAQHHSDPSSCCKPEVTIFATPKNHEITLECHSVKRLKEKEPHIVEWMFSLTEQNMKSLYESCAWGWNPTAKYKEMTESGAWYLIAKDYKNSSLAGFCHFRFVIDYGVEVLYCYELQVEQQYRSEKIGSKIMLMLETMSAHWKMKKVVLTVLRHNPRAIRFYMDLGYTFDETSPSCEEPEPHYIFSKPTLAN
ncbi:N-alpha-acetyltransferase 40-like [Paramacrobiotus metropolitanus]|uniref:N-alpha-acetyltransferase 40-like n=1 Tax=Paramacrobiotus metropolitanus TaxID=2943436 RepID=UPI002445EFB3|nr:N-alpha-acetyltransferase 40-like [Paramacrobiotus metropolitanus]